MSAINPLETNFGTTGSAYAVTKEMQSTQYTHTAARERRELLQLGPALNYKPDSKLPCNQTAHPCTSQTDWSCHFEGFLHFQRPETRMIREK